MDRTYESGAAGSPPSAPASPSSGYPTAGNPQTATPSTKPGPWWYHMMTEELRAVIVAAGLTPDHTDVTQLSQAIQALFVANQKAVVINGATFEASVANGEVVRWDSSNNHFDEAVADGTANNLAVGIADVTNGKVYLYGECPLFSGLTPGARYYLDASTPGAVTTTAPTDAVMVGIAKSATVLWVDVDAATAVTDASETVKGIIELATIAEAQAMTDTVRAITPATLKAAADARYIGIGYMMVRDEKAVGTAGGASVIGVQTRTLNTVSANTISGASLSSNQVTLPAGTYRVRGSAPSFTVDFCKAYLYNVTDAGIQIAGTSDDTGSDTYARSFVEGRFTIAATKVFELRHYTGQVTSNGLGKAVNQSAAGVEVYSQLEIIKEA